MTNRRAARRSRGPFCRGALAVAVLVLLVVETVSAEGGRVVHRSPRGCGVARARAHARHGGHVRGRDRRVLVFRQSPAGPPPFGAAGPPPFGAAGPPPLGAAGPPPLGAAGPAPLAFPESVEVLPNTRGAMDAEECCADDVPPGAEALSDDAGDTGAALDDALPADDPMDGALPAE